ncbi:hypothetical protein C8A00DRAFT_35782 [Chaetomidium leptoderma]|uniref:NACHT domain-containing protein n=1 Tax=Chaetomidium leptoderma TaxID=669021 RepID=A0AAN6ZVG2_9PEZI|nr:hypothetical protein C8A00DRAFT_35782 [Chaetomidium leptoderma]
MDAAANGKPIPLDDDGDLVVVVRGIDRSRSRSFLVSSRMLRLASRVFATMLGPRYQEGRQLQEAREKSAADQQPTITLEEDDLDAMDFIFSNIHFKSGRIVKKFTASAIAHIAIQSDKYDCNAALVPWIRLWCDPDQFPVSFTNPVRDMGYGLLAAYLFQSPKFDMMSAKFVEKLPSDFAASWKAYKFLSQLPKIVRDKLACEIRHTQNAIRLMVLSKLTDLYLGEFSPEFSDFDTDTEYAYSSTSQSFLTVVAPNSLFLSPTSRNNRITWTNFNLHDLPSTINQPLESCIARHVLAMEPVSALGVAAAAVQFVDFATRPLTDTIEIYKSASGQTERVLVLKGVTRDLCSLTNRVEEKALELQQSPQPESPDAIFLLACRRCKGISEELAGILQTLSARQSTASNAATGLSSLGAAIKGVTSESKIKDLTEKLQAVQQQIQTAALVSLWGKADRHEKVVVQASRQQSGRALARLSIIGSLGFNSIQDREDAIPKAYTDTFEWLFKAKLDADPSSPWCNLAAWLEKDNREIYWIAGKPGAGKSTLMKFLTSHHLLRDHLAVWSTSNELLVASFYFWNAGTDLQKSQEGLLRALLIEYLRQRPDLVPRVCQKRWSYLQILGLAAERDFPDWEWDELVECLTALASEAGNEYRLALFIDGLDEFDGDHAKLVDVIRDLSQWKGVKICVSSRPWTVFHDAFHQSPSLLVQDLTRNDIVRYVRGYFEGLPAFKELQSAEPAEAARLLQDIASRADGVFLWLADLHTTLLQLPRDVENLFDAIRGQISVNHAAQSAQYFLLLLESLLRPCSITPSAVTFFLADEDEESPFHRELPKEFEAKRSWMVATMRRRLHSRTMGLLEINPRGSVGFLHRTVLEWVTRSQSLADIKRDAPNGFDPNMALFKARTTELINLEPKPTTTDGIPQQQTGGSIFWELFAICHRHAALASHKMGDSARLVQTLDQVEDYTRRIVHLEQLRSTNIKCSASSTTTPVSMKRTPTPSA